MSTHRNEPSWRERYDRSEGLLNDSHRWVANGTVLPHWIGRTERFWYEREADGHRQVRVVDAPSGRTCAELSVDAVAQALADFFTAPVDGESLLLQGLRFDDDLSHARFDACGRTWAWRLGETGSGGLQPSDKKADLGWLTAPDGRSAVFVRDDNNFWLRDLASGHERPLTRDGTPTNAYGGGPASMRALRQRFGGKPEGCWSPDSRWFFTVQADDRHVSPLALMDYAPAAGGRPQVISNLTSLPSDPKPTELRMVALEVASGRQVEARYPRLSAVRMNDTPFSAGLAWWSADSGTAYFVDIERGEKAVHVVAFEVATGRSSVVFSEHSDTPLELSVVVYAPALVFPLVGSDELLWYSERSGRGHLLLVDLRSGSVKHPVTRGEWQVREVLSVDEARREVFFLAGGMAQGEDPYVRKPCIAHLDTGELRVLSEAPGDHIVWRANEMALTGLMIMGGDPAAVSGLSPSGEFFVETVGSTDRLPETVLRRRDGSLVALLEQAENRALPVDWQWPLAVQLKAADGVTDVYGLLFHPVHAEGAAVPLIDLVYGGPQVSFVPKTAFATTLQPDTFLEAMALATLGAWVLVLDGRGTAWRERAFRQASFGAVQTASNLEDHIAAIRQLAARHPSIDLGRVGITGFSGGGYLTALAALRHGDFFKVAVAGGGNYDQALFWHGWGERYHGPYDEALYRGQAAKTYASGLQGKLLLVHGLLDGGCHPAALFQLVQALIEANQDADLVVLPRAAHEWSGYGHRRRLDYLVTHLFGQLPPPAAAFRDGFAELMARRLANTKPPRPLADAAQAALPSGGDDGT
jgi:dipeptidyl aminopeptidase/acylaminoacyl peptidase